MNLAKVQKTLKNFNHIVQLKDGFISGDGATESIRGAGYISN